MSVHTAVSDCRRDGFFLNIRPQMSFPQNDRKNSNIFTVTGCILWYVSAQKKTSCGFKT